MSIGFDNCIRIWDTAEERLVGCIEIDGILGTRIVAFSADGKLVICTKTDFDDTKIWKTDAQELVFHSRVLASCSQGISLNVALIALRNCEPKSSYVWPKSISRLPGDMFVQGDDIYFLQDRNPYDKVLVGLPNLYAEGWWEFSLLQGAFVTTMHQRLAIYRLMK